MAKYPALTRINRVRFSERGPYGGIIQRLELPAFNRSIRVQVPVPLPYKNTLGSRVIDTGRGYSAFRAADLSVFLYGNVA